MNTGWEDTSEGHPPRRPRSLSFFVVLVLVILPFWSLVPLAWLFVFYSLYSYNYQSYSIVRLGFFFMACCEVFPYFSVRYTFYSDHLLYQVIFSIHYLYLAQRVARPSPITVRDSDELHVAFMRMLMTYLPENGGDTETLLTKRGGFPAEIIGRLERHDPRAIDFRNSIRTWFCKAPWSSIKLTELQKWLYWAMFHDDLPKLEEMPESRRVALHEAIALLEKRFGCKIDEGTDPAITPMRLSLDRMGIQWRPFSFYFLICSTNLILRNFYQVWWGVHYRHFDGIEYVRSGR